MGLPSSWLTAGAGLTDGPLTDAQRSRFGTNDWLALQQQGKTAHNVLTGLWGSQNQLAGPQRNRRGEVTNRGNKPGVAYQPGLTGGLFDRIQQQAQREAPAWNRTHGVNEWQYGTWGGQGFGAKDIEAATERGASPYQLRQLYDRAGQLGIRRDTQAAQDIAANAPTSEWDYGAHGAWGFGMADVNAIGDNLEQLKGARDWARQNKLNIGEGVAGHIRGLEQQEFNQQFLQQQKELAAETARIQREMAAAAQRSAEGAEYGRLASRRGGGSQTLGASGAATFKGKGLKSINKRGRGRGTSQLRRPYDTSSLSIASTGQGNNPSTLNL